MPGGNPECVVRRGGKGKGGGKVQPEVPETVRIPFHPSTGQILLRPDPPYRLPTDA